MFSCVNGIPNDYEGVKVLVAILHLLLFPSVYSCCCSLHVLKFMASSIYFYKRYPYVSTLAEGEGTSEDNSGGK